MVQTHDFLAAASTLVPVVLVSFVIVVGVFCKRAEKRAEALVQQHLTPDQIAQLDRTGAMQVASRIFKSRIYSVPIRGYVTVRDEDTPIMRLCVRPGCYLPGRESVVAHKIYIEAAEEEYIRSANVVWRSLAYGRV